jgi:hypothetical protein
MHNGNVKPFFWGPKVWYSMFSFVASYPDKADNKTVEGARMFFLSLKELLPCEACRYSYEKYIEEPDTNVNDLKNFSTRNSLTEFVYNLRVKVNTKLEYDYGVTLFYFKKKLHYMICENSYFDGQILNLQEVPFVPEKLEPKVLHYLKKKTNFDISESERIYQTCRIFMDKPNFDPEDKYFKLFYKRTNACRDIIKKIYINMCYGDYCVEDSFAKDFELHTKLLFMGCTILSESSLAKILNN